jgi:hypothetical protein
MSDCVHQALTALPEGDQRRLGVLGDWKNGPHLLIYRQAEYTFDLVAGAVGKDEPDGLPSGRLQRACDGLLEPCGGSPLSRWSSRQRRALTWAGPCPSRTSCWCRGRW